MNATASGNGATAIGGVTSASGWFIHIYWLFKVNLPEMVLMRVVASANANGEGAVSVGRTLHQQARHTAA